MEKTMKDIFLRLIFGTLKNCMNFIMTYHLQQRSKIKKFEKIVTNLHDRTEYVIHIKNLKQELNNRPILKKSSWSD